jgi:hypothetical protein
MMRFTIPHGVRDFPGLFSRISRLSLSLGISATLTALTIATSVRAEIYTRPIKEILSSHIGSEVDKTKDETLGTTPVEKDLCTVASHDECQAGFESSLSDGFAFPYGAAVAASGEVYVADANNNRVQVFSPTGAFVRMFGWEVNKTEDETPGAKQAEKNMCTAISGDTCKAGVPGGLAGQISSDPSIAIDHATGNVFVQDHDSRRVDEYKASGEFLLTMGAGVNQTEDGTLGATEAEKNVCTAISGDVCRAGVQNTPEGSKPGAFSFPTTGDGDLLAVGGAQDLLYVGDEHRVQEFDLTSGEWKGEISLLSLSAEEFSSVGALALDNSCGLREPALTEATIPKCKEFDPGYGDLYLVYGPGGQSTTIRKFTSGGTEVKEGHYPLTPSPREANAVLHLDSLAIDSLGHLAVGEDENGNGAATVTFGSLYDAATGRLRTEFVGPGIDRLGSADPFSGLAFSGEGDLYGVSDTGHEVLSFIPVHVADLVVKPQVCVPASEVETDVRLNCQLNGEVNPEEVSNTEVFFEWGRSPALGTRTPRQVLCTAVCGNALGSVNATVEGVRPNESSFFYRVAGYDQNVLSPERALFSEPGSFTTPLVAAWIGETHSQFVKASSVVLLGELNPENAPTRYAYQYATGRACEEAEQELEHAVQLNECLGVAESLTRESVAYGKIHTTAELPALQPATAYRYRMVATSHNTAKTETRESQGPEAQLTTAPAAQPQAQTGRVSAVGTTSATISGSVNPDGQPATYCFELGVYAGSQTQYGALTSGTVPVNTTPIGEAFGVSGLQPGTTYAYRIKISTPGFGEAYGSPVLFTTEGLPTVLAVPAPLGVLAMPEGVTFPQESPVGVVTPKKLTRAQQLARALKACKKKRGSKQRASCERSARKKYGTKSETNNETATGRHLDAEMDRKTRDIRERCDDAGAGVRDDRWRLCRQEVPDHLHQADQSERAGGPQRQERQEGNQRRRRPEWRAGTAGNPGAAG